MTTMRTDREVGMEVFSGNHIISRLSHEATRRSLETGIDTQLTLRTRQKGESPKSDEDALWMQLRPQDCVDEALMESFPASDPPAYPCHA